MGTFDPSAYGPAVADLLREPRLMPLGPGKANGAVRNQLADLTADVVVAPRPLRDPAMGQACLAALWLYHDFLDESHELSQNIKTSTGSYWHGVLHRREPDFDNARYWFRRVGTHPIFAMLQESAAVLAPAADPMAASLTRGATWDPFAFIDLCEASLDKGDAREALCRQIQQREWEILFDYCYRGATE
jgi:hypothetical protein